MRRRSGFTIVEIMVVTVILAVLIAILLPTVAKARTAGKRVACRAQLSDIGRVRKPDTIEWRDRQVMKQTVGLN